jgi:acetylornithine/succinyldiaminopimelate/putrescine aminotransferase/predicted amino acid dehydrogenase
MKAVVNATRMTLMSALNLRKNIVRSKGSYHYDDQDTPYLDFTSQYGVHLFGHNPDFLWDELIAQRDKPNMIQPMETMGSINLAKKLISIAPGKMENVIFANSGAEIVEAAIKMACIKTKRSKILSTKNSYHGKTMGAALATGNDEYREDFHSWNSSFEHVEFDNLDIIEDRLSSGEFAAFIVEPIQGEGGVNVPSPGYLKACEKICRKYKTLYVLDEVQTGLGRTGYMFACEKENVEPDIILLSKALGGGLMPISACISNARSWCAEFGLKHSSTFANNHLACHIGYSVINELCNKPELLEGAKTKGQYLSEQLHLLTQRWPDVFHSATGVGLMQGIKLRNWRDDGSYFVVGTSHLGMAVPLVASYLLNKCHVFTMPTLSGHNTLRIQPNLHVQNADIDKLIAGLDEAAEIINRGAFSEFIEVATGAKPKVGYNKQNINPTNLVKPVDTKAEKLGTFAFLMHPLTTEDMVEILPGGLSGYTDENYQILHDWFKELKSIYPLDTFPAFYLPYLPSKDGGYVDGWLISSSLTSQEMLKLSKVDKQILLDNYIKEAKELNVDMIGLGAFTSVISRSGTLLEDCDIPITTGNAYTALTSTEGIRQLCDSMGQSLSQFNVAIVGAKGSVGRLSSLDIARDCHTLTLIGNANNAIAMEGLQALAGEICFELLKSPSKNNICGIEALLHQSHITLDTIPNHLLENNDTESLQKLYFYVDAQAYKKTSKHLPIKITTDVENELKACDVIITATSNGGEFIKPDYLKPNAIICDAARPSDLCSSITKERPDVYIFEGGLSKLIVPTYFGRTNVHSPTPDVCLACLSETIILTMGQVKTSRSIGGISSIDEAKEIGELATKHGFSVNVECFQKISQKIS